jgi:hypothetical protein
LLMGENTSQLTKNVVMNFIFKNCVCLNFHQANIKRGFHELYSL